LTLRSLSNNATASIEISKGKITDQDNSGTFGERVGDEFGELVGIVVIVAV